MNRQLPNFTDSAGRILVPISEASKILGVSQQTLRRWDEKGKIKSQRPDGKNRYFLVEDLENFKADKKFTISEAAEFLGISQTTLRRLDEKGIVPAQRVGDDRVYQLSALEEFLSSQYFQTKRNLEKINQGPQDSINERLDTILNAIEKSSINQIPRIVGVLQEEDEEIHELFSFRKRLFQGVVVFSLISIVIVLGLTFFFIKYPQATSTFLGFTNEKGIKRIATPNISTSRKSSILGSEKVLGEDSSSTGSTASLIRSALVPFTRLSLAIVEKIDKTIYQKILPRDINEIIALNLKNEIVPSSPISLPKSSFLKIPDKGLINNLNADYLRGKVPGFESGDLAYYTANNRIEGLQIASNNLLPASVDLSSSTVTDILPLLNGGTGADLSSSKKGGILFVGENKLSATGSLWGGSKRKWRRNSYCTFRNH